MRQKIHHHHHYHHLGHTPHSLKPLPVDSVSFVEYIPHAFLRGRTSIIVEPLFVRISFPSDNR